MWHPNFHGFIATDDGAKILLDGEGYSVPNADDSERALTITLRFTTDDARYIWLNTAIVVLDGAFAPAQGRSETKGYLLTR